MILIGRRFLECLARRIQPLTAGISSVLAAPHRTKGMASSFSQSYDGQWPDIQFEKLAKAHKNSPLWRHPAMEALGAVASCLTLLDVSLKAASFARHISEAQEDFESLREEIRTINAIAQDLQAIPSLFSPGSLLPQPSEPKSIIRAASQLQQIKGDLDGIIAYCASDSRSGAPSLAKKRKWILKQNKISKLLTKARDAKSNLGIALNFQLATLAALQSLKQHRFHSDTALVVQSLRDAQQASLNLLKSRVIGDREDDVHDPNLEYQEYSSSSNTIALNFLNTVKKDIGGERLHEAPIWTERASAGKSRLRSRESTYPVAASLQLLLGTVGLTCTQNARKRNLSTGTNDPDQAFQETSIQVEYKPPFWLWARTLLLKATFSSAGLSLALRPARIIDSNHGIWPQIEQSRVDFALFNENFYPDDKNEAGQGLIEYAISYGSFQMVEMLIKKWENLESVQNLPRRIGSQVNQALDWDDCNAREVDILTQLLSLIDDEPSRDNALIHMAIIEGHGIMEALEEEPWTINEQDRYGMAPIHHASMNGDLEILKQLIEADADVNMTDIDGVTPLMFAALNGHIGCMQVLMRHKCNIEQKSHTQFRAIHYAAQFCQSRSILVLLAAGASASARGWLGQTALHRLARSDTNTSLEDIKETIKSLLIKGGTIDPRDSNGDTPTFRAVAKGNLPVVRCLIEAGASLLHVNNDWRNILHMAAATSNILVLEYLSNLKPKIFLGVNTEYRAADGDTPWDYFSLDDNNKILNSRGILISKSQIQSFKKIHCIVRDENLQHSVGQLKLIIGLLGQQQIRVARKELAHVINQKKIWGQLNLAAWYRGIDQLIQTSELGKAVSALEEDVTQLSGQIGGVFLQEQGNKVKILDSVEMLS